MFFETTTVLIAFCEPNVLHFASQTFSLNLIESLACPRTNRKERSSVWLSRSFVGRHSFGGDGRLFFDHVVY